MEFNPDIVKKNSKEFLKKTCSKHQSKPFEKVFYRCKKIPYIHLLCSECYNCDFKNTKEVYLCLEFQKVFSDKAFDEIYGEDEFHNYILNKHRLEILEMEVRNYFEMIQKEAQNCLHIMKTQIELNDVSNNNPIKLKEKHTNAYNKLFSIDHQTNKKDIAEYIKSYLSLNDSEINKKYDAEDEIKKILRFSNEKRNNIKVMLETNPCIKISDEFTQRYSLTKTLIN